MTDAPGISARMEDGERVPILPLTSVRFLAAAYVVLLHCFLWRDHISTSTWTGRFISNGYTAVGFFFTLSGFILAYVYLDTNRPFNRRAFWTARFARVYPLLFLSLLADSPRDLVARRVHHGSLTGLWKYVVDLVSGSLLLQAWHGRARTLNAPSWSLSAEAFFYLVFPFVAFWLWRYRGRRAIGFFVGLYVCAMVSPMAVTWRHPFLFHDLSSKLGASVELMPPFRIFEFLAGIALCNIQRTVVMQMPAQRRERLGWIALAGGAFLFVAVMQYSNSIPMLMMSDGLLLPVYAATILGLVNIRGWFWRAMSHPWPVLLGESSYAVYLLHSPIYMFIFNVHPRQTAGAWLLYFGLLLGGSVASFLKIERPMRRKILAWAAIRPPVSLQQETTSSR